MGVVLVAFGFTGFSGLEDLLVASGKDGLFSTGKFVSWGDVANRRVKAHGVVVFDEANNQSCSRAVPSGRGIGCSHPAR